ncbi:hypothetical protein FKM82_024916 [Ascaphus truei]
MLPSVACCSLRTLSPTLARFIQSQRAGGGASASWGNLIHSGFARGARCFRAQTSCCQGLESAPLLRTSSKPSLAPELCLPTCQL